MGSFVRLASDNGESLLVRVGPDGAKLSGGVGGTQAVDLPHDTQGVDWLTHPPYQLTLSLLFDGLATDDSVEDEVKTLYRMARAAQGAPRPPQVIMSGPVPRTDLEWLIEEIDEDESEEGCVRREGEDETARVRQLVTVTFVQDRRPELVVQRSGRKPKARTIVVHAKKGQSLRTIANKYHVKGGWRFLAHSQHPPLRDPRLKKNTTIRIKVGA